MLELLNQLDGFDSKGDVKVGKLLKLLPCVLYAQVLKIIFSFLQVIMATNRIETLDPALIRPGAGIVCFVLVLVLMLMLVFVGVFFFFQLYVLSFPSICVVLCCV